MNDEFIKQLFTFTNFNIYMLIWLPQIVFLESISVFVSKVSLLEFLDELEELFLVSQIGVGISLSIGEVIRKENTRVIKAFHSHL